MAFADFLGVNTCFVLSLKILVRVAVRVGGMEWADSSVQVNTSQCSTALMTLLSWVFPSILKVMELPPQSCATDSMES